MKKPLIGLVGVLLAGGVIGLSALAYDANTKENAEEANVESKTDDANSQSNLESEPPAPPTERTVDTGGEYPWNFLGVKAQKDAVYSGGQVYLMSDAPALEEQALGYLNNPVGDPENIVENYVAFGDQLALLVADLQDFYPDDKDYFLAISQAADALKSNNPDVAKDKIEEAKLLR
ncbi:hypothetical protein [Mesobacillus zeae]|uniref:Uncharacterized protein n=1 Tax=Mesobacillus zeae TaxID=1917180 RepID=A0A398B769_9BACI|nr:hypothetical protein [Mesobacillus zeae]RID85682.1 hypothetical protein D1970_09000 [Mesobacillus zeae]